MWQHCRAQRHDGLQLALRLQLPLFVLVAIMTGLFILIVLQPLALPFFYTLFIYLQFDHDNYCKYNKYTLYQKQFVRN